MKSAILFILLSINCASVIAQADFLSRRSGAIRVLNWNVGREPIFGEASKSAPQRALQFARILKAARPDVICLQEIMGKTEDEIQGVISSLMGTRDVQWNVITDGDAVIATTFAIRKLPVKYEGLRDERQANALIDLPDALYKSDLCLICVHFKAQAGEENIEKRQKQSDFNVKWIADAKSAGGIVDLKPRTPIVLAGDFNVYDTDPARHLQTLISGDVINEAEYGHDAKPDWDATDLADVLPTHNAALKETYTYRNDLSRYKPGTLDRVIYTDHVLKVVHAFVLNTTVMTDNDLKKYGLQRNDVMLDPRKGVHDHFPMVVDFVLK